jgi:tartrate dehydrogenase/decarboxylase/D-malate dehydrogenase
MPFWDERFAEVTSAHPQLESEQVLIDALAAMVVLDPGRFDVIVASNLFGDILSDLAAAVAGSIGIAPSGNLNPEREYPSMFEPVHGSAPDIAGQGIANPIGAIWSGAQMLEHLGEQDAAAAVLGAIEQLLAGDGPRTRDLGGRATTAEVTAELAASLTTPPGPGRRSC